MKSALLSSLLLLLTAACGLKTTNKYDVFNDRAELPQEEAPHPRNSLEWWYLTGHLKDVKTGETFGVEYVFFHFNPSGDKDYQMVNFAITAPQTKQFRYDYFVAPLPQLLTAQLPISLSMTKQKQTWTLTGQEGRYHLRARMALHPDQAIDLTTTPAKPVLLHGGTGYEQYGTAARAGYYSYPRLATTGTIEVNGKVREVTGELWYDRQWNCNAVMSKDTGWDWFSIQLDQPKEELMLYQLQNRVTGEGINGGSHYGAQAHNTHLGAADFQLETLAWWTSPRTGQRYPAKWRVRVPSQGYDLVLEPVMPDQELNLRIFRAVNIHYWEGMCRVSGTHHGQPVSGNSYIEITNPGK